MLLCGSPLKKSSLSLGFLSMYKEKIRVLGVLVMQKQNKSINIYKYSINQ